jgi:hypothetical protein
MATDFQSLLAAKHVHSYSRFASESDCLELALLQIIANIVAPTVATDYQSLFSAANVAGFSRFASEVQCMKLSLLQIIAGNVTGGGGGGGAGLSYGTTNPVNGTTTGGFYVNTVAGTEFVSQNNGANWTQIL